MTPSAARFSAGLSSSLLALIRFPQIGVIQFIARIRSFDAFNEDNDPHGEHDSVSSTAATSAVFWKIDYYDREMETDVA